MKLLELDGGIHSIDDLGKKFRKTIVFGGRLGEEPRPLYIVDMDNHVYFKTDWNKDHETCPVSSFNLIYARPQAGIYNTTQNRPLMVAYNPLRQWRLGWCEDNIQVHDLKGKYYNHISSVFELKDLSCFFESSYPSYEEAFNLLKSEKVKHIAINSNISIIKSKNKYIVLRNFVPFLSILGGMCFKIPPTSSLLVKDFTYYGNILKQYCI